MQLTQGHILVVKEPGSELISVSPEVWAEAGLQGWAKLSVAKVEFMRNER